MKNIKDLFSRQIDRTIEEVVKVDQHNEQAVANEIEEYVFTQSLQTHFKTLLHEILTGSQKPREGIGVWISGFFGSGKSLFAKMLAYVIENRMLLGKPASGRFLDEVKGQLSDDEIQNLLIAINTQLPFKAIIFDVSMDRGTRSGNERITEILYRKLLEELGYPTDFDLAALEIKLELDGRLPAFIEKFRELGHGDWDTEKELAPLNEASATLCALAPDTYPNADSWSNTIGKAGRADITPNDLAQRAFELAARRLPGKGLVFIVDEVGQYVARSEDKMLDLQAVVQAFGKEGKNRAEKREIVSPAWIIVTAQEKLNEVVSSLDSKRIELGKLQERFRLQPDLNQADISEVTSKRVLAKSPAASAFLQELLTANADRLKQCTTLERSSRNIPLNGRNFADLYPYLPYQIDLCIDVVAGFRLRRGSHRHIGGSNRTIIKQAQEMMINPATRLADCPLGTLVTFDKVYELLRLGNLLPGEITRELESVHKVTQHSWAEKVAKVIALLESIKDLPRTAHNIAVLLHPAVDADSCLKEVEGALQELLKAQFIRETEEGFKLLTAQEKSWDTTRNSRDPKIVERNRIKRQLIKELLTDPKVLAYSFNNLRRLKPSLVIDRETVESDGNFCLNLLVAEDANEWQERIAEARDESIQNHEQLFYVIQLSDEIHDLVTEHYRSNAMINEHELLSSQGKLTAEETACLSDEKRRRDRLGRTLTAKVRECLLAGSGFFQGVQKDASAMGTSMAEILHGFFDYAIPTLYPKLETGVLKVSDKDADLVLTSANLQGLPQVFYHTDPAKALVIKEGGKMVPNSNATLCREILDQLKREHSYGNKVTGKSLATHFGGIGYGWERESLRLAIAVLLRAGAIELTHQGRKYWNYTEPACRVPFANNTAFNAASFAPREALDLKILATAANHFEEITGKEVDIEEGAIAHEFRQLAISDREHILPLLATLKAQGIAEAETTAEHLNTLEGLATMSSDDLVKTLAGEGNSFKSTRQQIRKLAKAATPENLQALRRARRILAQQWPVLAKQAPHESVQEAAGHLQAILNADATLSQIHAILQHAATITSAYAAAYTELFDQRKLAYGKALEQVKGLTDWAALCANPDITESQRMAILAPLQERFDPELDLPEGESCCRNCGASMAQMQSDLAAVSGITATVIRAIGKLAAPEERIERIRITSITAQRISSEQELDVLLKEIRERVLKLLKQDVKVILE